MVHHGTNMRIGSRPSQRIPSVNDDLRDLSRFSRRCPLLGLDPGAGREEDMFGLRLGITRSGRAMLCRFSRLAPIYLLISFILNLLGKRPTS